MGSTRLPGKVLKKVNEYSLLEYMVERVEKSSYVDKVVIATSTKKRDKIIVELCNKKIESVKKKLTDTIKKLCIIKNKYKEKIKNIDYHKYINMIIFIILFIYFYYNNYYNIFNIVNNISLILILGLMFILIIILVKNK